MRPKIFKHSVILCAIIIALSCCNHPGVNNQQHDSETLYKADSISREDSGYNDAISNGQKQKNDGIFFLGYRMGMSPQEVSRHSKELVQKEKLQTISNNGKISYSYKNTSSLYYEFKTEIIFHYHKSELYKFEIKYLAVNISGSWYQTGGDALAVSSEFDMFSDVYESLGYKKYEPNFYSSSVIFGTSELIKDNIKLYLEKGSRTSSICFVDLYREEQARLEKKNHNALLEDALY